MILSRQEYLNGFQIYWIGKEYNKENILIFEGEYSNKGKNGKGKEFDNNGKLKFEGEYINNQKRRGQEYYTNGKIKFKGEYLNNKIWSGK